MNILLAGRGSIGAAFEAIYKSMKCPDSLTVCDIRNGQDCRELLRNTPRKWDLVINLTGMQSCDIIPFCLDLGVDYIDAALEDDIIEVPENVEPAVYYSHYLDMIRSKPSARAMFGFGMNPGIIEHMYFCNKPTGRHVAIEFEYDSAEKGDEIFCTWSPLSYFLESVLAAKIVTLQNNPYKNFAKALRGRQPIEIKTDGVLRKYCVIPHEETFNIVRNSPDCQALAFLYQAPVKFQSYLQARVGKLTRHDVAKFPVLHDIRGLDSVGMLFYDYSDNIYYVRNRGDHQKMYRKFGSNGTCWQTASGVFVAYRIIRMLNRGEAVTMSDISQRFRPEIDKVLRELDFVVDRIDHAVPVDVFREKILSWLEPELK